MDELVLRHERDENSGVISLWLDQPDKPVVVLDKWLLQQIEMALDWIDQNDKPPSGFILHSASDRVFVAGADLNEINGLDDEGLDEYLAMGQRVFGRIENLPCPSVACINGAALGGGLEICLACQYRIAAASDRPYPIGLPEAGLGILPGWGGTQRLAAVIKPAHAIGRTTTGRTFSPNVALRYGLVEAVVAAGDLHSKALELIKTNPKPNRVRTIQQCVKEVSKALDWAENCATRSVRRLPAVDRVIQAIRVGLRDGLAAGLKEEREALIALRKTPESIGLLGEFFARTNTLKKFTKSLSEPAAPTDKVAIVGDSAVARFLSKKLSKKVAVENIELPQESSDAQVFIAASAGSRQDQLMTLRIISALAGDDAVIVSTSAILSIDDVCGSITNAHRIVGLVPGLPVGKSQACEIIKGSETSDAALGAAGTICKLLGAVPIVQKNGGPTLLTRLFTALAGRAVEMALATGDPGLIDRIAMQQGFAAGPLSTIDLSGLGDEAGMINISSEKLSGITHIYSDRLARTVDPVFASRCTANGHVDDETLNNYPIEALIDAGTKAVAAGIVDCAETVWLAAVFGLRLGAWRRDWVDKIAEAVAV